MSKQPRNIAWRLSEMFVTSKLTILTILVMTIFGAVAIYLTAGGKPADHRAFGPDNGAIAWSVQP